MISGNVEKKGGFDKINLEKIIENAILLPAIMLMENAKKITPVDTGRLRASIEKRDLKTFSEIYTNVELEKIGK